MLSEIKYLSQEDWITLRPRVL